MRNQLRLLLSVVSFCALTAVVAAPGAALAKPDRPENAATTNSGTGCLVRDANGAYHFDATCQWHTVVRRDRNGNLAMFSYQDHGQLPANAPHPSSAIRNVGPWPACAADIHEETTPSGEYRSDCRYHAN